MAPRSAPTPDSTDLRIEYRPLDELLPYERNERAHTAGQIAAIERSLVQYGWTTPVGVADSKLVYGHARVAAAKNLRERKQAILRNSDPNRAPVVDLSHLSASQRRAYVIADNQLATRAGWDADLLRSELADLKLEGFSMPDLGFEDKQLARLLSGVTEVRAVTDVQRHILHIDFETEQDLRAAFDECKARGWKCKVMS
jgi:ParB-like chromosome segregation protein Spo0J